MKKLMMNLHWFDATTYTTTIYKDSNITTATASPTSGTVAEGATVTLTIEPASGYELDEIEVVSGGVTVEIGDSITFEMGDANVVLNVTSKKSTLYKVVENCYTCINGTVTQLTRNMTFTFGPNGAIVGVNCSGTDLASLSASIIEGLVASGVIIKM